MQACHIESIESKRQRVNLEKKQEKKTPYSKRSKDKTSLFLKKCKKRRVE